MRQVGALIGIVDDAEGQSRVNAVQAKGCWGSVGLKTATCEFRARYMGGVPGRVREHTIELLGGGRIRRQLRSRGAGTARRESSHSHRLRSGDRSGQHGVRAEPGQTRAATLLALSVSITASGPNGLRFQRDRATAYPQSVCYAIRSVGGASGQLGAIQGVAPFVRVKLSALDVREAALIDQGINGFTVRPPKQRRLIVLASPTATVHLDRIIAAAAKHRLPAIYPYRFYTAAGGLISYGVDHLDLYHRAASYVDRIFKGEKPSDLPVQQPTKFHLAINLRTAKSLGLIVPPTLIARADEVIE